MRIAFTSCMDATRMPSQPIWQHILAKEPDVLFLLGDQIYMDWGDLGQSNWKRLIERQGAKALDAYAEEMHERYAAQARVPTFHALVKDMASRGKQVLAVWDDHDFAWNNSLGDGPDNDKHWVDPRVKAISHALFCQFRDFIAEPLPLGNYPPLSDIKVQGPPHEWHLTAPGDGIQLIGDPPLGGQLPFALLDTRWYRTPRGNGNNRILGTAQWQALQAMVSQNAAGLLVVAGGSPLKHKYLFSEQDWHDSANRNYVEYETLLNATRRPVLYLSGDIHRVAWSGRVDLHPQTPSQIIQLLASPAAIANVGPKRFPSAFGWLDIGGNPSAGGTVIAQFISGDTGLPMGTQIPTLPFDRSTWTSTHLEGEASSEAQYLAPGAEIDQVPLTALICLDRKKQWITESADLDDLETLDECYREEASQFSLPDPIEVGATPSRMTLSFNGNPSQGNLRTTEIAQLLAQTFARAANAQRSVVFFIHGLGKSPVAAIDQGYALRARYDCEPVVFCWPAGRGGGPLAGYFDAFNAKKAGSQAIDGLRESIRLFGQAALNSNVPAVVVARSGGASLLKEMMAGGASNAWFKGIARIVLSSPAIETSDFYPETGNAFMEKVHDPLPTVFVTVNRNDQALLLARWFSKLGPALGVADPRKKSWPHVRYLDFTDSVGVGPLHDYLIPNIGSAQDDLNRRLLREPINTSITGHLTGTGPFTNVFNVP